MVAKLALYYKAPIQYDYSGKSSYVSDLYDNPDRIGDPVGNLYSSHNSSSQSNNNHPIGLPYLYKCNKLIEIYNKTDTQIRRYADTQ